MYESHKDMKITGPEWDAFMDDFQQTLDKFSVPAQEQAELKTIVDSTRADIVVEPEAAATSWRIPVSPNYRALGDRRL